MVASSSVDDGVSLATSETLSLDLPAVGFQSVLFQEASGRLDKALAGLLPHYSRARLQQLIGEGHLTLNGVVVTDCSVKIKAGDTAVLREPEALEASPQARPLPLDILFEDDHLLVVYKPAGLVVHPGVGTPDVTLVHALLHHCGDSLSGIGGVKRPGIVHRLDKDTSGLLVVAKNDKAHRHLSRQFEDHGRTGVLERAYYAFVWGKPHQPFGTVHARLDRSRHNPMRVAVVRQGGREAVTHYEVVESYGVGRDGAPLAALVRCQLETGRTHQIRVHMAHLGHPLLGDDEYGAHFKTKIGLLPPAQRASVQSLGRRQALHAALLTFEHPLSHEVMHFESDLPDDLQNLRDSLRGLV